MRIVLMTVLLLFLPAAVGAAIVSSIPDAVVDVEISVAGTVPLASGPFLIEDTFFLHGTGSAHQVIAEPGEASAVRRRTDVQFNAFGGGVTASGSVFDVDAVISAARDANLNLITSLYELHFSLPGEHGSGFFGAFIGGAVTFFASSTNNALVRVGDESAILVGTATFSGTGVVPRAGHRDSPDARRNGYRRPGVSA